MRRSGEVITGPGGKWNEQPAGGGPPAAGGLAPAGPLAAGDGRADGGWVLCREGAPAEGAAASGGASPGGSSVAGRHSQHRRRPSSEAPLPLRCA